MIWLNLSVSENPANVPSRSKNTVPIFTSSTRIYRRVTRTGTSLKNGINMNVVNVRVNFLSAFEKIHSHVYYVHVGIVLQVTFPFE